MSLHLSMCPSVSLDCEVNVAKNMYIIESHLMKNMLSKLKDLKGLPKLFLA